MRPDLDQLRRQAKDLLRAARTHDPGALARFRVLPSFVGHDEAELVRASPALHDAQSVIARELGFPSWKALRGHVEEATLGVDEAVEQFIEAATDGRRDRAERLLARRPQIARATFHTALVLGDADTIEARLAGSPELATGPGGPRGWEPLLYVCHTALARGSAAPAQGGQDRAQAPRARRR